MTLTAIVLAALVALSFGLSIWQLALAWRFPLHRRDAAANEALLPLPARHEWGEGRGEGIPSKNVPPLPGPLLPRREEREKLRRSSESSLLDSKRVEPGPGIAMLKPLKGCDAETRECLQSWFAQEYAGPVEILFGVDSEEDPACDVVRGLLKEHPRVAAQLVVCGERLGPNAKVSKLAQLAGRARYEVVCMSDADVRVPADFLANAVEPLRDPRVGLVNCFYRLANPANFAMRWETFAVNADFWSQVLQSAALKPMDFALGAVMVAPRRQLDAIGGYDALVEYLADDYELGRRIARRGAKVAMCPVVVDCRTAPMGFAEVWEHQLRWARTIRVCQPGPYFLSILGNATLWPLWLAAARPSTALLVAAGVALAWRMAQGFLLERRMGERGRVDSLWLAPVKDLLQIGVWAAAFAGREVVWRGERFRVSAEGKLTSLATAAR